MLQACPDTEFCSDSTADNHNCAIFSIYAIDNIYDIHGIQRHRSTRRYTECTRRARTGIA